MPPLRAASKEPLLPFSTKSGNLKSQVRNVYDLCIFFWSVTSFLTPFPKINHVRHRLRYFHERLHPLAARRFRHHGRHTAIRIVADAGVQRNIAQKGDAVLTAGLRDTTAAATAVVTGVMTEDGGGVGAGGTGEGGHVLDHAEDLCFRNIRVEEWGGKRYGGAPCYVQGLRLFGTY